MCMLNSIYMMRSITFSYFSYYLFSNIISSFTGIYIYSEQNIVMLVPHVGSYK